MHSSGHILVLLQIYCFFSNKKNKKHRGGGARWMVVVVCTPAENRTLIKGLGNLYSIH